MRLIDADTLKAEFTGNFQELWHYTAVKAIIDNAPTIDDPLPYYPECDSCKNADKYEPKKGKWEENEDDYYYSVYTIECSCCNHEWYFEVGTDVKDLDYNYCPNCGARMETEDES